MRIILHAEGLPKQEPLVKDLKDAAAKWVAFRDLNELGASDMKGRCGDVVGGPNDGKRLGKTLVARVSYNGRIWGLDGKEVI
jgi:hypothetical protein